MFNCDEKKRKLVVRLWTVPCGRTEANHDKYVRTAGDRTNIRTEVFPYPR